ncbi:hypothetical protein B0H16DRAFT_1463538 [Mycena metata]|uniref:Uncharacterized protein n=1 Tax=Mycena metata TaxID=1033252 RepID=A0AAD7N3C0_9AGAR|nr:hypothetical protein B0H16DRAFT_1463538 [Mycena metata]
MFLLGTTAVNTPPPPPPRLENEFKMEQINIDKQWFNLSQLPGPQQGKTGSTQELAKVARVEAWDRNFIFTMKQRERIRHTYMAPFAGTFPAPCKIKPGPRQTTRADVFPPRPSHKAPIHVHGRRRRRVGIKIISPTRPSAVLPAKCHRDDAEPSGNVIKRTDMHARKDCHSLDRKRSAEKISERQDESFPKLQSTNGASWYGPSAR